MIGSKFLKGFFFAFLIILAGGFFVMSSNPQGPGFYLIGELLIMFGLFVSIVALWL